MITTKQGEIVVHFPNLLYRLGLNPPVLLVPETGCAIIMRKQLCHAVQGPEKCEPISALPLAGEVA